MIFTRWLIISWNQKILLFHSVKWGLLIQTDNHNCRCIIRFYLVNNIIHALYGAARSAQTISAPMDLGSFSFYLLSLSLEEKTWEPALNRFPWPQNCEACMIPWGAVHPKNISKNISKVPCSSFGELSFYFNLHSFPSATTFFSLVTELVFLAYLKYSDGRPHHTNWENVAYLLWEQIGQHSPSIKVGRAQYTGGHAILLHTVLEFYIQKNKKTPGSDYNTEMKLTKDISLKKLETCTLLELNWISWFSFW